MLKQDQNLQRLPFDNVKGHCVIKEYYYVTRKLQSNEVFGSLYDENLQLHYQGVSKIMTSRVYSKKEKLYCMEKLPFR